MSPIQTTTTMVFRTINAMALGLGDRSGPFGLTAARLDGVFNILLAPFCGLILSLSAAFAPAASPLHGFNTMRAALQGRGVGRRGYGWRAGAGLAGPRRNGGAADENAWIGEGRARATPSDIGRAIFVSATAWVMATGGIGLLALFATGLW